MFSYTALFFATFGAGFAGKPTKKVIIIVNIFICRFYRGLAKDYTSARLQRYRPRI